MIYLKTFTTRRFTPALGVKLLNTSNPVTKFWNVPAEPVLSELKRVTKPGGTIIIPTYINKSKRSGTLAVKFIELLGANFKRQFDFESYKQFFADMGYSDIEYEVVDGRMPCALAVIKN